MNAIHTIPVSPDGQGLQDAGRQALAAYEAWLATTEAKDREQTRMRRLESLENLVNNLLGDDAAPRERVWLCAAIHYDRDDLRGPTVSVEFAGLTLGLDDRSQLRAWDPCGECGELISGGPALARHLDLGAYLRERDARTAPLQCWSCRQRAEDEAQDISPAVRAALDHRTEARGLAAQLVLREADRACEKWPRFNSAHEGWAVIREELDELWDLVKRDRGRSDDARTEAVQIAAMCLRYIGELTGGDPGPAECWRQVPDDQEITVRQETITHTAARWSENMGRGYLCGEE